MHSKFVTVYATVATHFIQNTIQTQDQLATCETSWLWPAPCRNSITGAKLDNAVNDTDLPISALIFCSFGPRTTSTANCQNMQLELTVQNTHILQKHVQYWLQLPCIK